MARRKHNTMDAPPLQAQLHNSTTVCSNKRRLGAGQGASRADTRGRCVLLENTNIRMARGEDKVCTLE